MSVAQFHPAIAEQTAIYAKPLRLGYQPSLDGLRAFAVLAVMGHHAYIPFLSGGSVGVDVFFVLSGFLITSLLLEEWRKTGDISLRKFYLRRVLRLIPALLFFLILIETYSLAIFRGQRFWEMERAIASVIFYVGNWVEAFHWVSMGALSHAWSLSIEEQFYLIWPLALLLLLRNGRNERTILWLLGFTIVLIALRRILMWTGPASIDRIYFGGDTRSDELLAGCALGLWVHRPTFRREKTLVWIRYLLLTAFLSILVLIVHPLQVHAMYTWGWPLVEVAVCVVILSLVLGAGGLLQKLLELRPAVWTGRLSYGLYLWHFPILERAGGWHHLGPFRPLAGFALSFAAAATSYYLVELWFLRRKKQFASA
jgi:peptidoglycan/LPS O-acetylase OafA/YrhL